MASAHLFVIFPASAKAGSKVLLLCVRECPAEHVLPSDVASAGTAARGDGKADASERYYLLYTLDNMTAQQVNPVGGFSFENYTR